MRARWPRANVGDVKIVPLFRSSKFSLRQDRENSSWAAGLTAAWSRSLCLKFHLIVESVSNSGLCFSNEPLSERDERWVQGALIRPREEISVLAFDQDIDGRHERSRREFVLDKEVGQQRNADAGDRGLRDGGNLIEEHTLKAIRRHAVRHEPFLQAEAVAAWCDDETFRTA
jgi:hypothetical protein